MSWSRNFIKMRNSKFTESQKLLDERSFLSTNVLAINKLVKDTEDHFVFSKMKCNYYAIFPQFEDRIPRYNFHN